eukprot:jgi/Psemu1/36761/gm1.36761_g
MALGKKQTPSIEDIEFGARTVTVFTFKRKRVPIQAWKRPTWRLKQHDKDCNNN